MGSPASQPRRGPGTGAGRAMTPAQRRALAALAVGARFRSASIHPGRDTEGRVHGIQATGDLAFVVDAAGQIAERLVAWTTLSDERLRAWLPTWRDDGGDAR